MSVESPATGLSRKSHLGNPAKWLGPLFNSENATQFADVLGQANDSRLRLNSLRIPAADRYLSALDESVRSVLIEGGNAVEQLATATRAWTEITEDVGIDEQKSAYRNSEGLSR